MPIRSYRCRRRYWDYIGTKSDRGRWKTGSYDPEPFPFQTTQTRLNRRINTRDSAYSVLSTCTFYAFPNRNSGSAMRSATDVGNTEEARVFRENFYGGKLFQCLNKKDNKNSKKATCQVEFFKKSAAPEHTPN